MNELVKEEAEDRDWEKQEIATLEKERDEALEMAAQAEKAAAEARDKHGKKVDLMKKQFDNRLAIKEAKIASLESRLANISALLGEG